ncbi:DUF3108 domain-containing protein [Niabella ginsengisoli]|uniref:DUF3108 domain-containing protein n=1 Tax=Niabella ginsengisoli TaxID=522298 RepID=A0ABS9SET0_9BACT|nr:DUF3108 domain-containing protein [Niabella ginsengisoli]MCH5596866.1 DUF3108 domain-containing protein [Niabella ginsengisoli]
MKALRLSVLAIFSIAAMANTKIPVTTETDDIIQKCGIDNTAFKAGEKVGFVVYYTAAKLINVTAGAGSFTTTLEKLNGKSVYHVVGEGHTLPSYEWAYKAKDVYETYMDVETLLPLKFVRDVNEGGYKKYQNVGFNRAANTAISNGVYKIPACAHDVVSAVFWARNIDYNKLKVGDRIGIKIFLDNENHDLYVRYLGKETISTKYGKFKAIKIRPTTIKGTIFSGDDQMTVWVTDDANRVPIRIESPIIVGKVRIDMTSFQNLRSPMTSLIKKY